MTIPVLWREIGRDVGIIFLTGERVFWWFIHHEEMAEKIAVKFGRRKGDRMETLVELFKDEEKLKALAPQVEQVIATGKAFIGALQALEQAYTSLNTPTPAAPPTGAV